MHFILILFIPLGETFLCRASLPTRRLLEKRLIILGLVGLKSVLNTFPSL